MRIVLILMLVVAAGCQERSAPSSSYFPLVRGATWTRKAEDGADITARVVAQKTVGPATCAVVETKTARDDRERITRVCYEATPSEIRVVETESGGRRVVVDPPRTVLLLPPEAGRSWSWVPTDTPVPSKITEQWVGEETVKVAAGTFKAWKVKTVTTRADLTVTLFTWYAPGVGIVKIAREEQRGELQREGGSELVRYAIP